MTIRIYQASDGTKAYDACPVCGGKSFANSWHGPMFGIRCSGCGTLGTCVKGDDNPMLFMPANQNLTPFHLSVLTKHEEPLL